MSKPVQEIVTAFVYLLNTTKYSPQAVAAALLIAQGDRTIAARFLATYGEEFLIEVAESLRHKMAKEHDVARIFSFNDAKWLDKDSIEEIKAALQRAGLAEDTEVAPKVKPTEKEPMIDPNVLFKVPPEDRPDALQPPATSVQDDERTAREAFVMTERTLIKRMRDRAHAAKRERDDVLCVDLARASDRMHTKLAAFIVQHNMEGI